jgi:hypothetical protein
MVENRPFWEALTRLYFWGWAALLPLMVFAGVIGFVSSGFELEGFLTGFWFGLLNLGILWTGIFLLISVGRVVVGLMLFFTSSRPEKRERIVRTFADEFREIYGLGWAILIAAGFIAEFLAHSFHHSGGLFVTLAIGVVPMTLIVVLLTHLRCQT